MGGYEYRTPEVGALYDRYADILFRIAYAELLSKEDAEDAVQEVFAKYLRKPPAFAERDHEKAWFLRVTVNQCHDQQRRRSIRTHTPLEEIADLADSTPDARGVLEELFRLPEKYKTAILLHYFEGLSIEQIAATLKISKSAVKMRLARGRELLRQEITQEM